MCWLLVWVCLVSMFRAVVVDVLVVRMFVYFGVVDLVARLNYCVATVCGL